MWNNLDWLGRLTYIVFITALLMLAVAMICLLFDQRISAVLVVTVLSGIGIYGAFLALVELFRE